MPNPANLIHQTSTTTGTGNFTLVTVNGSQAFATAFSTGGTNVFDYFISSRDSAEYERGTGHMIDATTLARDTVIESTNANAAVSFSSGTKDVCNDVPAGKQVYGALGSTDNIVPRVDGTTGLTLQNSVMVVDDNGTITGVRFANTSLKVLDSDASHVVTISIGTNITSNRTLSIFTGDADRSLTINGTVVLTTGTTVVVAGQQNLTGGFSFTSSNNGTISSGTLTPDPLSGNIQHYTNGGAHTLAPPTNPCMIVLECTNASAGAITTSGFSIVSGDVYSASGTRKYLFRITKTNSYSELNVTYVTGT